MNQVFNQLLYMPSKQDQDTLGNSLFAQKPETNKGFVPQKGCWL
jgi:hypothetical protein